MNYFQPSFQLLAKNRNEGNVTGRYSKPAKPCDRLLCRDDVSKEMKQRSIENRAVLGPVSLLQGIRKAQATLREIRASGAEGIFGGERLERFLYRLTRLEPIARLAVYIS